MKLYLRSLFFLSGFFILWQSTIILFHLPSYILPTPGSVMQSGYTHLSLIMHETQITVSETLIGLLLGIIFGCLSALLMAFLKPINFWLLPLLIVSQAIPTFAIAPLLVIWFGYGITSKIAATIIMIFFPITSSFFDGLQNTDPNLVDLAYTMNAKKWRFFWYIKIPAALPHLASGLRIAAVAAPIGAVVGEWVGASQGLGFLMLNANARMQIDLMFAGLFTLILFALTLYFIIDKSLKYFIPWEKYS